MAKASLQVQPEPMELDGTLLRTVSQARLTDNTDPNDPGAPQHRDGRGCGRVAPAAARDLLLSLAPQPAYLEALPPEIFQRVCACLQPIWLWNLSHSYGAAFRALAGLDGGGGGAGNLSWYRAMPVDMWRERALHQPQYQPDDARRQTGDRLASVKSAVALRTAVHSSAVDSTAATATATTGSSPAAHNNMLLGGPYRRDFDYKREIVERFKEWRCNICLSFAKPGFGVLLRKEWGIKFCTSCFVEYTICKTDALLHRLY